jgi:hypothetical protein
MRFVQVSPHHKTDDLPNIRHRRLSATSIIKEKRLLQHTFCKLPLSCLLNVLIFLSTQWQCGDSFDFSIALCSLLLGSGYDAYCVAGYAPKDVTTNDQSHSECPFLNEVSLVNELHL